MFHEVDVARVELILDIRREFAVDDEALSLVLGLLDQVYSLRRQMRRLCDALESQPPEIRDAIRRALRSDVGARIIGFQVLLPLLVSACGSGKRRWKLMSQLGWSIQGGSGGKRPTAARSFNHPGIYVGIARALRDGDPGDRAIAEDADCETRYSTPSVGSAPGGSRC